MKIRYSLVLIFFSVKLYSASSTEIKEDISLEMNALSSSATIAMPLVHPARERCWPRHRQNCWQITKSLILHWLLITGGTIGTYYGVSHLVCKNLKNSLSCVDPATTMNNTCWGLAAAQCKPALSYRESDTFCAFNGSVTADSILKSSIAQKAIEQSPVKETVCVQQRLCPSTCKNDSHFLPI